MGCVKYCSRLYTPAPRDPGAGDFIFLRTGNHSGVTNSNAGGIITTQTPTTENPTMVQDSTTEDIDITTMLTSDQKSKYMSYEFTKL